MSSRCPSLRRASVVLALTLAGACASKPSSPVCLGGSALRGGHCRAQEAGLHHLPFREGFETRVQQAFHGYLSHKDDLAYSVDLKCEEGVPIVASRAGIVWDVKEDSTNGCGDASCIDDANYVIIDNGDGTYSEYYHLRHLGVLVEEGQTVCPGQVVAVCGNTGFSTGAHLHFSVTDTTRRTVPFQFVEARRSHDFGFPIPDTKLTSRNRVRPHCGTPETSSLGKDAFTHHGIVLRDELPTTVRDHGVQKLRGRYFGDHPKVALHRKSTKGGAWLDQCVDVDANGDFELEYAWPHEAWGAGRYWLMMTGAGKDCLAPGWSWSYKMWLR